MSISKLLTCTAVLLMCQASSADDLLLAAEPQEAKQADADGRPRFDDENAMLLPQKYREWIFVGSSIGLGYKESEEPDYRSFSHVYINPLGYRAFRKTGTFPVGTVLMLEQVSTGEKSEPALSGLYADQFTGLEAAVKTGDRFDDEWTYFNFSGKDDQLKPKAHAIQDSSCIECHREHAAVDHVFTQFYPVLRAVRPTEEQNQ